MFKCYRFPPDHDFSHADDVYADFFDFRRELRMVFAAQASSRCQTVVGWLTSAIVPNLQKMAALPFTDAEALLGLVAHFPPAGVNSSSDFQRLVAVLCQSNIASHPHRAVNLAFFEILLRYPALISRSAQAIRAVFAALLGPHGMKHPRDKLVRGRSCYCMRKLLRSMGPDVAKPFAKGILSVLGPIAASAASQNFGHAAGGTGMSDGSLGERDYMSVFEMVGVLTSAESTADPTNGGTNQQLVYIDAILTPTMKELNTRVTQAGPAGFSPAQGAWAARVLLAMSHFARGFPNTSLVVVGSAPAFGDPKAALRAADAAGNAAVAARLVHFFNLAASTLRKQPRMEELRRHSMTLAHTLLERTGAACLPALRQILAALLGTQREASSHSEKGLPAPVSSGPDTTEVLQLIHDATLKLGQVFAPYLEENILGLMQWVRASLARFDDAGHAKIAFRALVVLVGGIVDRHVWTIFASDRNLPHFGNILDMFLKFMLRYVDTGHDILKCFVQLGRAIFGSAAGQPVQRARSYSSGAFGDSPGKDSPTSDADLVSRLQGPGQKLAPVLLGFVVNQVMVAVLRLVTQRGGPGGDAPVLDPSDAQSLLILKDFVELQFSAPPGANATLCSTAAKLLPPTVMQQYASCLQDRSPQSAKALRRLLMKVSAVAKQ